MRRMIWLTQDNTNILVNPAYITTVFEARGGGSHIYLVGEDDALEVDESPKEIDRLISLG